ncbi:MFS transporter [Halomonas shantousis]
MSIMEHHGSRPATRLAIAFFFALNGLALTSWAVRLPDLRETLALGQAEIGLLLLCPVVGTFSLTLFSGYLNGRYGSRRMTIMASLGTAASLLIIGLAADRLFLGLGLIVFGAGEGLLNVAMNDQAASLERRYRRSIMSSFHGMFSLGGMAGALIGGGFAALGLSPSIHLPLLACLALVGIGLLGRYLLPLEPRANPAAEPLVVRPRGQVWLLGALASCTVFIEGAMTDWSAIYMTELGAQGGYAALGLALFTALMAGGRLVGDRWLDAVSSVAVLRIGGLLAIAGMGLAVVVATPGAAMAGFALTGLGLSTVYPCLIGCAGRSGIMSPAGGIAAVTMLGYVSLLGGPPMIGLLAEFIGLRGALVALVLAGGMIVALAGRATRGLPARSEMRLES